LPPPRFTRDELRQLRTAARQNWAVPDELKLEALFAVAQILRSSRPGWLKIAATKALVAMDRSDQADEHFAWQREQAGRPPFSLVDMVRDMENRVAEYERHNGDLPE
jgi:hypothetical protein